MLYYLAMSLMDKYSALNVFNYHTVRAGGAMITGFLFCLVVGPALIRVLRRLKIGQYIRQEHVQDLHALHKDKAGTPTMGGALIILATVVSLGLWSTLTNRLLLSATGVLCLLGVVGFMDDFIKLRRKDNHGLTAKAKLTGQVLVGAALGLYVVLFPVTYGASFLSMSDVLDWPGFAKGLSDRTAENAALGRFGDLLAPDLRARLISGDLGESTRIAALAGLNEGFSRADIYEAEDWQGFTLNGEAHAFLDKGVERLNVRERARFHRILLEAAAPGLIKASPRGLHTKVGVPGMKDVLVPLGMGYVLFVILIIVASSNAVNLTDGLDGLAIGASIISIFAFTIIAYVVSRADWSGYLFVLHVPEASELTIFGAALLGAGLGFLWFNAHPAEVFMGDTGSLALGGVIGSMAVLTKQELLLPIVGGLFVLEALSVILQVGSFKLTGKRVFRMAPLHHHFELKGWSESKVTIRFWILALVFALMSIVTLKLR